MATYFVVVDELGVPTLAGRGSDRLKVINEWKGVVSHSFIKILGC